MKGHDSTLPSYIPISCLDPLVHDFFFITRLASLHPKGLEAAPRIKRPVKPHMHAPLPNNKLKSLIAKGIDIVNRGAVAEAER